MRPLPRLLRYAPKAREGTLKLHFYLESIQRLPLRGVNVSVSIARSALMVCFRRQRCYEGPRAGSLPGVVSQQQCEVTPRPALHVVALCAIAGSRLSRVFYCATPAPPAPYFPLYVSTFLYPLQRGAHRLCDNALPRHIFCVHQKAYHIPLQSSYLRNSATRT